MPLTVLIGGARSGKSSLAVHRARTWASFDAPPGTTARPVVFVVTGVAGDDEMRDRISRHQRERDPGWTTVEAPRDLTGGVRTATSVSPDAIVVVDCLSFWVANRLMEHDHSESDAWARCETQLAEELAEATRILGAHTAPTVVVTNEVGSGLVPDTALGRQFRDTLGRINAIASLAADDAFLVVAGRTLELARP